MQEKLHFIALRLAKRGIPHYQIAFRLGITTEELRNLIIWDTLFHLASSGQNTAATLFWLRTRAGAVTKSAKPQFDDEEDEELPPPPVFIIVDKNGIPYEEQPHLPPDVAALALAKRKKALADDL